MKSHFTFLALVMGVALGPDSLLASHDGTLTIRGSDTLGAKMVPLLAEAYKAAGNDVTFEIAAEGSLTAFSNLKAGTADVGMSSRDAKNSEKAEIPNLREFVAGIQMIAVIVNANNPIPGLTKEQIRGIFTGAITDWAEVGGSGGAISAYTRNTSSRTYKAFQGLAMNNEDYGANLQKVAGSELAQKVGENTYGIGYIGLAYASAPGVKVLEVDGVLATKENASTYPLSRNLYYYTAGAPTGEVKKFIDWATSDAAAHIIVEKVGFIAP